MQVLLQVQRMSAVPPDQQYRGLRHALLNIPAREGWQVPALWWLCKSDALNAPSMLHGSVLTEPGALHLTAMQLSDPPPLVGIADVLPALWAMACVWEHVADVRQVGPHHGGLAL